MSTLRQPVTEVRQCETHGAYEASNWSGGGYWSKCPKCAEIAAAAERAEESRQRWAERIRRNLEQSGIPLKFQAAQMDASIPAALHAWLTALKANTTTGPAVLVGSVGTGKTFAACAALIEAIRAARHGGFVTASQFGRTIRDQWTAKQQTEQSIIERFALVPVLVLDDVGAQRAIDTDLLQELIAERYAAGLMPATIVTTNYAAANLSSVLGERAADRLREGAVVIPVTGQSRRKPA